MSSKDIHMPSKDISLQKRLFVREHKYIHSKDTSLQKRLFVSEFRNFC